MRPGFEGGQLPLIKRLPKKRGFYNMFRVEYSVVNVSSLNAFEAGSEVTAESLKKAGLVKSTRKPLKVLAGGDLDRALTVRAQKFSAAARTKIEGAGGKAEEVGDVTTEVD
jgi:large subunit ribosomal protein L15